MIKRISVLSLGVIVLALVMMTSCQKDKKINKNLWKNGGEWNIVSIFSEWDDNGDAGTEKIMNAGTYEFNKDNTGKLNQKDGGSIYSNTFTYKNTENTLSLIFNEGPLASQGEVVDYDMDWSKNKIKLQIYSSGTLGWSRATIELEKK